MPLSDLMQTKQIMKGVSTYFSEPFRKNVETSDEARKLARFCYAVWFRNLSIFQDLKDSNEIPSVFAELGPGNSLGVGLTALLTGVSKYYALDINRFWNPTINTKIFNELSQLFENNVQIPTNEEFPQFRTHPFRVGYPVVNPAAISSDGWQQRKTSIERSISDEDMNVANSSIKSIVPWKDRVNEFENTIDLLTSQDSMEHVENIVDTYGAMWKY